MRHCIINIFSWNTHYQKKRKKKENASACIERLPLSIVQHQKDRFHLISKGFISVSVCISNEKIKNSSVYKIKKPRSLRVNMAGLNSSAVFWIFFPSETKKTVLVKNMSEIQQKSWKKAKCWVFLCLIQISILTV